MKKLFILLFVVTLLSCTENIRTKSFGGSAELILAPGRQLVNVTWKEADLWVLTTYRPSTQLPKIYEFKESSNFGVWEGTYIIKEQ